MTNRLPVRVGVGVGLVAGYVLALQVLLTQLFSGALCRAALERRGLDLVRRCMSPALPDRAEG